MPRKGEALSDVVRQEEVVWRSRGSARPSKRKEKQIHAQADIAESARSQLAERGASPQKNSDLLRVKLHFIGLIKAPCIHRFL